MESTPKCLRDYFSLKKVTMNVLASMQDAISHVCESSSVKVMILTANGTYMGTIVTELATLDNYLIPQGSGFEMDMTIINDHRNKALLDVESEGQEISFVDNGAIIYLKDAETIPITKDGTVIKFPYLIIFVDQIIGFSLVPEQASQC